MKLGIIGTGNIVHDALFAMEPLKQIAVNAIFARPHSREKGEKLAAQYHIPEVYTDYDALLDKADVDAVYIGLVNSAHYDYARRALQKGRHVILEKPFTGTLAEAEALVALAKERGVYIFEAITVLHNDVIERMRAALPKLGPIRLMLSNYSQYSSRYDRYRRGEVDPSFDPATQGGALRDINIYNIHYAAWLLGAPLSARYCPNRGFNGVDTSGALALDYGGCVAVCAAAKDSDSPSFVSIQGEKGFMRIDGKPNLAPNLTVSIVDGEHPALVKDAAGGTVRAAVTETFVPEPAHHRMTREFADFARIVDERDDAAAARLAAETLDAMRILDMIE